MFVWRIWNQPYGSISPLRAPGHRTNIHLCFELSCVWHPSNATAVSKKIAGLLVLGFLAGFFVSPALSNGGASVADVFAMSKMPSGIAAWGTPAICGPAVGPLIGAAFVKHLSRRWAFWSMLICQEQSLRCWRFTSLNHPKRPYSTERQRDCRKSLATRV